jgi:SAM-dependent methyltransferase
MASEDDRVRHYDAAYGNFAARVYAEVRADSFGTDIGQTSWLTAEEQDAFIAWLRVSRDARLLDVACGSGGPVLRIAQQTGCRVHGIDIHADAVSAARAQATSAGLEARATFERVDASRSLPFADGAFDAMTCIDAINHLPDRHGTLTEWARILRPGGRLVFTDPIVVTGALSSEEIAVRSSIGFFLFVPEGLDEAGLDAAGFDVVAAEDHTENVALMAARRRAARAARAEELRRIEGDATFDGQQRFFEVAARLAAEHRLSRFAYCAHRRS